MNWASMYALTQSEKDALEALVDRTNMGSVLDALATIASEKAEHLRSNWQDEIGARAWDKVSTKLAKSCDAVRQLVV